MEKQKINNNLNKIINLFFELGQLRRVPHVGFTLAGVKEPDTVAEHTTRAASAVAYFLRLFSLSEAAAANDYDKKGGRRRRSRV